VVLELTPMRGCQHGQNHEQRILALVVINRTEESGREMLMKTNSYLPSINQASSDKHLSLRRQKLSTLRKIINNMLLTAIANCGWF
jgi:hypothetical protein